MTDTHDPWANLSQSLTLNEPKDFQSCIHGAVKRDMRHPDALITQIQRYKGI